VRRKTATQTARSVSRTGCGLRMGDAQRARVFFVFSESMGPPANSRCQARRTPRLEGGGGRNNCHPESLSAEPTTSGRLSQPPHSNSFLGGTDRGSQRTAGAPRVEVSNETMPASRANGEHVVAIRPPAANSHAGSRSMGRGHFEAQGLWINRAGASGTLVAGERCEWWEPPVMCPLY